MRAFVGLGSNLGDRESLIRSALDELAGLPETRLIAASSLYDTDPVGDPEQPRFLNAVAHLETGLTARQLLWNFQRVERRLGRVRTRRWEPRTIDLDLLLYGQLVVDEPDLQIPHPELLNRTFVLVPLVELDPALVHPVTHESLLSRLTQMDSRPPERRGRRLHP